MAPFPCGHSVNQQRVARMLEVLPFPASKKKLCADCRTKTSAAILEILNKINDARMNNNNSNSSNTTPTPSSATPTTPGSSRTTPKRPPPATPSLLPINSTTERSAWLAYLLDRLLAHRRALTKTDGKEAWMASHLGEWARVAFLCVGDDDDLKAICDHTVRPKHGSAAEEEVPRALARAALVAYDVDRPNEPAAHRIVAGLNDFIVAAGRSADEVRNFGQVRAVFASAAALRHLASEVSTGATVLYDLFDDFEREATPASRRGSLTGGSGGGSLSRTGSRRVASGLSARLPRTPRTPL
ncbi:hypothetical protein PG994_005100 [Apiospora phragmitis]|uniref:Uncharacterized protein n=1 Tax=Apiospora phragmitis TaxID=2905665 RepID=A0ABR1VSH5_9PEZI